MPLKTTANSVHVSPMFQMSFPASNSWIRPSRIEPMFSHSLSGIPSRSFKLVSAICRIMYAPTDISPAPMSICFGVEETRPSGSPPNFSSISCADGIAACISSVSSWQSSRWITSAPRRAASSIPCVATRRILFLLFFKI